MVANRHSFIGREKNKGVQRNEPMDKRTDEQMDGQPS